MNKIIKNKLIIFSIFVFSFLLISPPAFASSTYGTIDSTYRYGWGENIGWIDFGSTIGDVRITDEALSGYAYGENIGFINLSGVTNDEEGNLSSYAWGENVGFIDFDGVTIDSEGYFNGQAYGENIGFITFTKNAGNMMLTDYRPKSARPTYRSGGSSSYISRPIPVTQLPTTPVIPPTLPPTTIPPISPITDGQATPPVITRILKLTTPRMIGTDVKDLQTYLNSHGYDCGIADGIFGKKTKAEVIKFQLANHLVGDGVVGPITRALLK